MGTLLSALHLPTPTSYSAVIIGRFALANAETSISAPLKCTNTVRKVSEFARKMLVLASIYL